MSEEELSTLAKHTTCNRLLVGSEDNLPVDSKKQALVVNDPTCACGLLSSRPCAEQYRRFACGGQNLATVDGNLEDLEESERKINAIRCDTKLRPWKVAVQTFQSAW